ncbi:Macrophage erythroblast attacher [Hypsibius exemplaris]|uniref:E3 ubiquitin-protein transferase MAEA n=1 Tax=Hypsibius exemplaris TaxID=2072580 RepID=A0A1W0XFH7_HYPEX|nr:Macrophage erythroblast attacher [Hypsibius exemplaris]
MQASPKKDYSVGASPMQTELTALEHPTIKVPYEIFNKRYRLSQKIIEKEQHAVAAAVDEIEKQLATAAPTSVPHMVSLLDTVMDRLRALKRKSTESFDEDLSAVRACKTRVSHLRLSDSNAALFEKRRLDRMLVEYCFRCGYYDSATMLAKKTDVEELSNMDLFLAARDIEVSLARRETEMALAWCNENRSRLKKQNSFFEFYLRQQEVIELIKKGRSGCMDAILHARKHFPALEDFKQYEKDIQKTMTLLAVHYREGQSDNPYQELLSDTRWHWLIEEFRREIVKMYQLSPESVFGVTLQAGLSALKTPACFPDPEQTAGVKNKDCPVCQDNLHVIAECLPFAHCSQSRLVCFITGEPLNESTNRPMMLPNGYVYGEKALAQMAGDNDGTVTCPRTQNSYKLSDAQRVFVL